MPLEDIDYLRLYGLNDDEKAKKAANEGDDLFIPGDSDRATVGATFKHWVYLDDPKKIPAIINEGQAFFIMEDGNWSLPFRNPSRNRFERGIVTTRGTNDTDARFERMENNFENPWLPGIPKIEYLVDVPMALGDDPHVNFFLAAHDLRDRIAANTNKAADQLPPGHEFLLITICTTPIMAMPKEDKGFELYCTLGQLAVLKEDLAFEGSPVNRKGQVPIDAPNQISMKMLMHMEEELENMGVLDPERNAVTEAFKRTHKKHKKKDLFRGK